MWAISCRFCCERWFVLRVGDARLCIFRVYRKTKYCRYAVLCCRYAVLCCRYCAMLSHIGRELRRESVVLQWLGFTGESSASVSVLAKRALPPRQQARTPCLCAWRGMSARDTT